jgi:xanthine phosphoribosyltransferase
MVQFRDDVTSHAVSWLEVHRDMRQLAETLLPLGPWKGIVAITRGGLVPAAILARELNIRTVETLCILSYDEQVQGSVSIVKQPEGAVADLGEGWLMVDDIVDTGATAKAARDLLPKAYFAAVFGKPAGMKLADVFMHKVSQDTWVYFPWDTTVQYIKPLVG